MDHINCYIKHKTVFTKQNCDFLYIVIQMHLNAKTSLQNKINTAFKRHKTIFSKKKQEFPVYNIINITISKIK